MSDRTTRQNEREAHLARVERGFYVIKWTVITGSLTWVTVAVVLRLIGVIGVSE